MRRDADARRGRPYRTRREGGPGVPGQGDDAPRPGRPPSGSGDQDLVHFGSDSNAGSRWPGWRRLPQPALRWLVAGTAALVVIAASLVLVIARSHPRHGGSGQRLAAAGRHGTVPGRQWYAASRPVAMETLRHPLLGVRSGWELFAMANGWEPGADGTGVLVRIQFASGRVSRTRFTPLNSSGLADVIAGPHQVIIRPMDSVPGYLVPDGRPARRLPAGLGQGGPAFPGPGPDQVWVGSGTDPALSLVTMNGVRAGPSIRQLPESGYLSVPDGRGYVLTQQGGAVYDTRPDGVRQVAAGTLAAAGPAAWLIGHCQAATRCVNVVIDPATGARRVLPGPADLAGYPVPAWPPGVVSPDGRTAAVLSNGPGHAATLHLVNLRTGAQRRVILALGAEGRPGLAWSPDSRWLFSITSTGALQVIDPGTGQIRGPGVALPPVTYLAVRTAP